MRRFTIILLVLFALSSTASFLYAADADAVTVLKGARIIDGTGNPPLENGAVVIKGNQITAVGPSASVKVPKGAKVVDVSGRTIIPGLFSAHSHVGVILQGKNRDDAYTRENVMAQLNQYEQYGVTSIVALGTNRDVVIDPIRAEQSAGTLGGTTIFSGDRGFGAPKGAPPLQLAADQVYRPTTPEEALKVLRETIARHPDILKIWVDDVFGQMTKMDPAIYKAIIEEAHKNNLKVAAHVFYLGDAKALVAANLDVLAHSVRDLPVDQELISMMKAKGTWYIPTFTVDQSFFYIADTPNWQQDSFLVAALTPEVKAIVSAPNYKVNTDAVVATCRLALAQGMKNYKALHDAGIKLAFGTDSGANPPTRVPGFAEHHELELMVEAGIKPMEAITIATQGSAALIGAKDRGTIAKGKRADLIVLAANPLDNISNTKTLVAIYHNGQAVTPRASAPAAKAKSQSLPLPGADAVALYSAALAVGPIEDVCD
jgi:imidazolonepropionase-like amidohydrolase